MKFKKAVYYVLAPIPPLMGVTVLPLLIYPGAASLLLLFVLGPAIMLSVFLGVIGMILTTTAAREKQDLRGLKIATWLASSVFMLACVLVAGSLIFQLSWLFLHSLFPGVIPNLPGF